MIFHVFRFPRMNTNKHQIACYRFPKPHSINLLFEQNLYLKKFAEFLNFLKFFMNGFSKEKNHKIVNSLLIDWNIRHSYYVGWFTLKIQNFRPHALLKILNLARKKWVIHRVVLNKPSRWTVTLGLIYELDGLKINNWGRAKTEWSFER